MKGNSVGLQSRTFIENDVCKMRIWWDIRLCDDFHVSNQGIRRIEIFSSILYLVGIKQ